MSSFTISIDNYSIGLFIFNLNDVLLDTSSVFESALRNAIKEFYPDVTFDEYPFLKKEYKIPMGLKLEKLKHELKMPFRILEKIDWIYEEYAINGIKRMHLKSNVVMVLNQLTLLGINVAVITNTRKKLVRNIIKATELNKHVDYIKCTRDKDIHDIIPDSHIIEYVCKHFKMPKINTVYVDSTSFGIFMGDNAGVHTIEISETSDVNTKLLDKWRID